MRSHLPALAVLTVALLAGCSTDSPSVAPSESRAEVGDAGRAALEDMSAAVDRLAARVAARVAAEDAAAATAGVQQAAEEAAVAEQAAAIAAQQAAEAAAAAAAQRAAEEAAAAQAADGGSDPDVEEDDGYVSSDLEVRCSDGTATVEECFGPGSDLNGNGIADVNE
jgi:nucleoid-associated protein YgaU